jgi:cellulose synthase/poly-beta-1,6-N-acetylglucosamine synthase-like glycosyltransferase
MPVVLHQHPRPATINPTMSNPQTAPATTPSDRAIEHEILSRLGFGTRQLAVARDLARRHGTTAAEELIRLKYLSPGVWWPAVADALRVRYLRDVYLAPKPAIAELPDARHFRWVRQAWLRKSDAAVLVVAPRGQEIDVLQSDMAHDPGMRRRIAIASPHAIRRATKLAFEPAISHQAINQLKVRRPAMSASNADSLRRRIAACILIALALGLSAPLITLAVFSFTFLLVGALRLVASVQPAPVAEPLPPRDETLPRYTVLVPLFREARIVADLVRALERIDYPADRLSIHLVVEADDRATRVAAESLASGTRIQVIAVPPSLPRTKPKALAWALAFVDGDLVTIYDAEDRPAPDQLRRAVAAFAAASPDLVCLQAMLDIDHAVTSNNWFARQFTLEYRVLFRLILPWLAQHGLFLPLGGTSNHFRRDALVASGAWDPFNVTEDADLSVRLMRDGGRIGVLHSVTMEEAPMSWRAWHLQRTRWMKGWLQTWLVHMRQPRRLLRDLGLRNFVALQVLILGQFISALVYPFGLLLVGLDVSGVVPLFADRDFRGDMLLAFQLLALACGWFGTIAAICRTRHSVGAPVRLVDLATLPIYWLLLFGAALAAIAELIVDPHQWNKTGHGIAERTTATKGSQRWGGRGTTGRTKGSP